MSRGETFYTIKKFDFIFFFNSLERDSRAIKKEPGKEDEFIEQIKTLRPYGGGDCEEMAFTGILEALKKQPVFKSPLYVFTDAPPKDLDLANDALIEAKTRRVHVYFFLTKDCGTEAAYKPFEKLARKTCGQVFHLPKSQSEIAKLKNFAKELLDETECMEGPGIPGQPPIRKKKRSVAVKEYKLMVDDTMEKIIISISSENSSPKITLRDPLGNSVGKTTVSKVTIFQEANPKPGLWTLTVPPDAGKHTYLFKGTSKTNMAFNFIFVMPRLQGTPIPISNPLTGENSLLSLSLSLSFSLSLLLSLLLLLLFLLLLLLLLLLLAELSHARSALAAEHHG